MSDPGSLLPAIVLAPFAAALAALAIGRLVGRRIGAAMVLAGVFCLALTVRSLLDVTRGTPVIFHLDWIPALNIAFRLRGDGFGLFFALLISGIGALVGIYSLAYIPQLGGARLGRYYAALSAFMGAMLGIALSDDLMLLFVFWEITSIASFILIGFWYEEDIACKGALTALLVTALGGLAMMAGFVLVGLASGSFTISSLASDPALQSALAGSPFFLPALLLILAGAFTKSAQVPFHFWLPAAMVAPTPVSTYLHAATMVKAGIFLLGRMLPVFGTAAAWSPIVVTFGLATFALGAYQAYRETDLKALLAQSTVSTLGLITMLYGLRAADQDSLQILSHATYKGALFLVAGIVEHVAHTRDLHKLGGLRATLPITFWICLVGALSMAGLPPCLGFLAKESLYAELLHSEVLGPTLFLRWGVILLVVVSNAFLFATSFKLVIGIFLGSTRADRHPDGMGKPATPHAEDPWLWFPAGVLAAAALLLGLPGMTSLVERAVNHFSSDPHAGVHLSLWPLHPAPLLLSLLTTGIGTVLYRERARVERLQGNVAVLPRARAVWDRSIDGVNQLAVAYSARWQNGSLHWYFSAILAFTTGIVLFALNRGGLSLGNATASFENVTWYGVGLCALTILATLAVVRATTRLAAAIALTSVGFLVALMYVVYRSPDIVLTQILIETVSTIFILLVLYFMPTFRRERISLSQRVWNGGIAAGVGVVMFLLVLLCTSPEFRETDNIGKDYLARSLSEAGGQNAVNVIIVDFRAMDTQGEITVLVVVGLCVFGLLRTRRKEA